jgi:arabinooligosaccharide transport system permease protein
VTRVGRGARAWLLYGVLIVGVLISLMPLVWTLVSSLKTSADIFEYPPSLIPDPLVTHGYSSLFDDFPFVRWVINSLGVAAVATVIGVFLCALGGYGFAKYEFRGKKFLFTLVLSSMMVPFVVLLIPLFVVVSRLNWVETYQALVVPWLAPAFGVFMMRQYIAQSVPNEMLDAGRIDGASEFTLFRRIVLPVIRPALAALAVWLFLNVYNAFLWPLVVMSDTDRLTLPLGLASILNTQGISNADYSVVMAGALLAAAPTIVLFIVLRKQFIEGLTLGSVKG